MKKKLLLIIIGLIFTFFLLEILFAFAPLALRQSHLLTKKNDNIILCLGNSFTYGIGAPQEESYPNHLQNKFNQKKSGQLFQVVNEGRPNINSSFQREHLEEQISKYHPELIILQTGEPNKWNRKGFYEYLQGKNNTSLFRRLFFKSHLYQFFSYLYYNRNPKTIQTAANVEYPLQRYRAEYWNAILWSQQIRAVPIKRNSQNDHIAQNHLRWINRGIEFDSKNPQSYASVGMIYFYYYNDPQLALEWAIKSREINPNVIDMTDAIELLRNIQSISNPRIKTLLENYNKQTPSLFHEIFSNDETLIWKWAESDIEKMIQVIQKKNIKLVLLDYPPHPYPPLTQRPIDRVIKRLAEKYNVPFLSIYDVFFERAKKSDFLRQHYWEKFGILDVHPNSAGYKLIAEEIYFFLYKKQIL